MVGTALGGHVTPKVLEVEVSLQRLKNNWELFAEVIYSLKKIDSMGRLKKT